MAIIIERFSDDLQRSPCARLMHVSEWLRLRLHDKRRDRMSELQPEHWRDLPRPMRGNGVRRRLRRSRPRTRANAAVELPLGGGYSCGHRLLLLPL